MPHAEYPDLALVAYEAYARSTGGKTYDGRDMPAYDDLGDTIQAAWQAAAQAVVDTVAEQDASDGVALAPAPQLPSVGRIVLVLMNPEGNNGAKIAPAVITRVWTGTSVNVRILADFMPADTEWRTSLTYVDDLDAVADDDLGRLSRWSWPPRV